MIIVVFLLSASATIFSSFDSVLDPNDITYPVGWYTNSIDLSSNHAGESVTITVNCNTKVLLLAGYLVTMTIPGFSTSKMTYSLPANQAVSSDNQFVFSSVVLPSSSVTTAYGPVSIVITSGQGGDVIASNLVFGSIAILPFKAAISNTLIVSYYQSASTTVSASTTLCFNLTTAFSLQKYDYFVLSYSSPFTVQTPGTITWLNPPNGVQFFNTSANYWSTSLSTITVYGLQTNITNSTIVAFTASNFINPYYVTPGNSYSWNIEFFRFGTHTSYQKYSGTGPSVSTTAGNININSWLPSNGYISASNIVQNTFIYMTTIFVPQNDIPASGTIIVSFNNIDASSQGYLSDNTQQTSTFTNSGQFYLITPAYYFTSCSISLSGSTSTVTCGLSYKLAGGTSVSLYALSKFINTGSASINYISTTDGVNTIGKSALNAQTINYASSSRVLLISAEPKVFFTSSISSATPQYTNIVGSSNVGLQLSLIVDSSSISSGINVNLQSAFLSSSAASDTSIAIGSSLNGYYESPLSATVDFYTNAPTALGTSPTVSNGIISFSPWTTISSNQYINILIRAGSANSFGLNNLPNFPSNQYTRYEIYISYTSNSVLYQYSKVLTFASNTALPVLTAVCPTPGIAGITASLSITPAFSYNLLPGYTAYVQFTIVSSDTGFPSSLGSGLISGSTYPTNGQGTSNTVSLIYSNSDSSAHQTNLLLTYNSNLSTQITFQFPFTAIVASKTYTPSAKIYIKKSSDNSTYILSTGTGASYTGSAGSLSFQTTSANSGNSNSLLSFVSSLSFTIANPSAAAGGSVSIIFPQGFSLGTSNLVITGTVGLSPLTVFSSSSYDFLYPSAFYSSSSATTLPSASSSSTIWTVSSVTYPWFSQSNTFAYVLVGKTGPFDTTNDCLIQAKVPLTVTSTSMTFVTGSYSPLAINGIGPDNQLMNLSISVTTPGVIKGHSSSKIQVVIGSGFSVSGSSFIITLGTFISQGSLSSNTFLSSAIVTDLPAGTLKVQIQGLTIPTWTTSEQTAVGFSSIHVLFGNAIVYNYDDSGSISVQTTINSPSTAGTSQISVVNAYPNIKGSSLSHVQILFSPTFPIPAGSNLTITGETFLSDSNANTNTWFTAGFSSVIVYGNTLSLITRTSIQANSSLELRKDQAFAIGSSSIVTSWTMTATYKSVTIISDIVPYPLYYQTGPSNLVVIGNLTLSVTNQGSASQHSFLFKLSFSFLSGWIIMFDVPKGYNAHFGPTFNFDLLPSVFYLNSSSSFGYTYCYVDHWRVTCTLLATIPSNTLFDIQILGFNPASSSTGSFIVYFYDSSGNMQALINSGISAVLTSIPLPNIDLALVLSGNGRAPVSDYLFSGIITGNYQENGQVSINFPLQYNLQPAQGNMILCSASVVDTPDMPNIPDIPASNCGIFGNSLIFSFSSPVSLSNTVFNFVANSIANPLSGIYRNSLNDGYFDATDASVFNTFDFWTNKFEAYSFLTDPRFPNTTAYYSKSYMNLNAAYTGFYKTNLTSVLINSGNTIYLQPGTYSAPISISVPSGVLKAKNLTISPASSVFQFDSKNYVLSQNTPSVSFIIGANITTFYSIYYVNWIISETPINTGVNFYANVTRSVVEAGYYGQVSISVTNVKNVPNYASGLPMFLTIPYGLSTFSDFTISFFIIENIVSNPFTFAPTSLKFTKGVNSQAFIIINSGNLTIGQTYHVNFTIKGTDASAYSLPSSFAFSVGSPYPSAPTIKSIYFNTTSQTTLTGTIKASSGGIITWALAPTSLFSQNTLYQSYDYIASITYPIIGTATTSQLTLSQQISNFRNLTDSYLAQNTSYTNYTYYLIALAGSTIYTCQEYLSDNQINTKTFDWLIANTSYSIYIWLDNYSGLKATSYTTGSTADLSPASIVSVTFSETQPTTTQSTLYEAISLISGIPTNRMSKYGQGWGRRLDGTSATIIVSPSYTSSVSPTTALASVSSSLTATLISLGVSTSGALLNARNSNSVDFPTPYFTTSFLFQKNFLYFNSTPGINGFIYYVVEYEYSSSQSLTGAQIIQGLGRNGKQAFMAGSTQTTANQIVQITWNFENVKSLGNFVISCNICNQKTPIPQCLSDSGIASFKFVWNNGTSDGIFIGLGIFGMFWLVF